MIQYRRIHECNLGYLGEVNSKNSYGGFTGWSYFAYAKDGSRTWVGDEEYRLEDFMAVFSCTAGSQPSEYTGVYKMSILGLQMLGAGVGALASCLAEITVSGILVAHPLGGNCTLSDDLIFGRVSDEGKIFRDGKEVGEILKYDERKRVYSGRITHPLGNDKSLKFKLKRKD